MTPQKVMEDIMLTEEKPDAERKLHDFTYMWNWRKKKKGKYIEA